MGISLTGPWAGVVVAGLGLMLLLAPASWLYRKNRLVVRRASSPVPLWATVFYRVLGLLLLALAAALLWPALQHSNSW